MSMSEERVRASTKAACLRLSSRLRAFAIWGDRGSIIYAETCVAVPHPWTIYCPASFVGDTRVDAMRTGTSRAYLDPACPDSPFSL